MYSLPVLVLSVLLASTVSSSPVQTQQMTQQAYPTMWNNGYRGFDDNSMDSSEYYGRNQSPSGQTYGQQTQYNPNVYSNQRYYPSGY